MRILFFVFILCLCLTLYAQDDKVFLKNGSLIRGTVAVGTITDTILIGVMGSQIAVPLQIVDEVRLKNRNGMRLEGYKDLSYPKGWSSVLEGGVLIGSHWEYGAPGMKPMLRLSQEYQYHPFLNGGMGAGLFLYDNYTVFPVTFDYHALLGRSHRSWMLYGGLGYGFARSRSDDEQNHEVRGGLHYQAGVGWQQRVGSNYVRFKFGYALQVIEEENKLSAHYIQTRTRRMNRITAQVSYRFKY